MNFDFTEDQQTIKRTAREFLGSRYPLSEARRVVESGEPFSPDGWRAICELGWPGLFLPESDGGSGLGFVELVILQEELGYALAPTPFHSNAAASLLLAAGGREELASVAAGELRATIATWEEDARSPADSSMTLDDGKLSGTKVAVPDAAGADLFVVALADHRYAVVGGDADGVTVEPAQSLDPTRPLSSVSFDSVDAGPLEAEADVVEHAEQAIGAALAAESVGIAQRAMEMAVEYAKERKQFDTPIGAYQGVSHRCAQMLLEVEGARSLVYHAGWALDHAPESAALATAMAQAYGGDCGFSVTASSLQVHGGIGFTWEHDLHMLLKRAKANAHALGDARLHRARVADLAGI
ncbi:MAG TPA: acyl-CoA dehydrogenase family protein [Solirubrobacteraceae bacterium]|nr:acyl-CoA dehydrogenase family protein [Solirubrobacteraceae bacterium]